MKYVCIAIVSLLILCTSAMNIDEPRDLHACNVSETNICGFFISHRPEKKERTNGTECYDDITQRRVISGTDFRRISDTFIDVDFTFFEFFRDYTMTVNGRNLQISAKTIYSYEKYFDVQKDDYVTRCDKFHMNPTYAYYHKAGVPADYTCRFNFFEGWVDQQQEDGVKVKLCNHVISTDSGKIYLMSTVTDKKCYPVRFTEVREDSLSRTEILQEISFFNWRSPGVMALLPAECWNV